MGGNVLIQGKRESDRTKVQEVLTSDEGYLLTSEGTHIAGHRNTTSNTTDWVAVGEDLRGVVIDGTAAVTIGGGAANDTFLYKIKILANFTGNLTIAGFNKKSSSTTAAKTITLTTPTAGDYDFSGILNEAGALVITASNAADDELAMVFYKVATD